MINEPERVAIPDLLSHLDWRLARRLVQKTLEQAHTEEGYDYLELQTPRNAVQLEIAVRLLDALDLVRIEDERMHPWGLRRPRTSGTRSSPPRAS